MAVDLFNLQEKVDIDNPYVRSIINIQQNYASGGYSQIVELVNRINDDADALGSSDSTTDIVYPTALSDGIDFDFSMDAWLDLLNRKPTRPDITDFTIDVILPEVPTISIPTVDAAIITALWNQVYTILTNDLTNGGYGIETADEMAIWQRAKEREVQELNAQYEDADEVFSSAGYKFPSGALVKMKQKARQAYQNKLADINREMTIERLKLFVQCRQFALEKGAGFGNVFAEIEKLKVQLYETQVKAALGEAEIEKVTADNQIQIYKADINAYETEGKVFAALYELASTEQERELKLQIAALEANIEIARVKLQQKLESARLKMTGATASADVYKAIAASALGSIHCSATMGSDFNIGWSYHKAEQVSRSYQESATVE